MNPATNIHRESDVGRSCLGSGLPRTLLRGVVPTTSEIQRARRSGRKLVLVVDSRAIMVIDIDR